MAGSGFQGRVVAADVEHAKLHPPVQAAASTGGGAPGAFPEWAFPDFTDMPVKMVQKITAARLLESKQTVPHYYLTVRPGVTRRHRTATENKKLGGDGQHTVWTPGCDTLRRLARLGRPLDGGVPGLASSRLTRTIILE